MDVMAILHQMEHDNDSPSAKAADAQEVVCPTASPSCPSNAAKKLAWEKEADWRCPVRGVASPVHATHSFHEGALRRCHSSGAVLEGWKSAFTTLLLSSMVVTGEVKIFLDFYHCLWLMVLLSCKQNRFLQQRKHLIVLEAAYYLGNTGDHVAENGKRLLQKTMTETSKIRILSVVLNSLVSSFSENITELAGNGITWTYMCKLTSKPLGYIVPLGTCSVDPWTEEGQVWERLSIFQGLEAPKNLLHD
ncbi:hypothetical protein E5288_WYG016436 [Bos mutus]|uniref:Uncharacterized protein n=1 Tax=Bos mutus TaxID=72004 RepID=A0A6B0RE88_9CETA|nr:hypothetical protein [Bos mutus]